MGKEYIFQNRKTVQKENINVNDKYYAVNDNLGEYSEEILFVGKGNLRSPNFVGYYKINDSDSYFSLPGYIYKADEEKKRRCENNLLEIFRRYCKELSYRDPLFNKCSQKDSLSKYLLVKEIVNYYLNDGPLKNEVIKYGDTGSVSWSQTIKKIVPDIINNTPMYNKVIRRKVVDQETDITNIERMVLLNSIREGYISEKELNIDYAPGVDLKGFKDEYSKKLDEEILITFDDIYNRRLQLLKEFILSEYKERTIDFNKPPEKKIVGNKKYKVVFKGKTINSSGIWIALCFDSTDYYSYDSFGVDKSKKGNVEKKLENIKEGDNCEVEFNDYYFPQIINIEYNSNISSNFNKSTIVSVADFNHVLELLLSKLFDSQVMFTKPDYVWIEDDKYTKLSKCIKLSFTSKYIKGSINDINDDIFRSFNYNMLSDTCFVSTANKDRCDASYTNFPDLVFETEYQEKKYCVIVDAKNYGYDTSYKKIKSTNNSLIYSSKKITDIQRLPKPEDVYKQFCYEDIFTRIYKRNAIEISIINVFILPQRGDIKFSRNKELGNLLFGENNFFEIEGFLTDDLRNQSILVIRVDVDILMESVLYKENNTKIENYRMNFVKGIIDYIKNHNTQNIDCEDCDKIFMRDIIKNNKCYSQKSRCLTT